MRGSLERLEEYERFYFPGGRCNGCQFPLQLGPNNKRIQCPGFNESKCNYFVKCERPSCPGLPKGRCVSCGVDCCGIIRCQKCRINYVCNNCLEKHQCEMCFQNSDYYCAPCQGPLRLWVIAYAGNVKPTLRQMVCQACFDNLEDKDNGFGLERTCVKCAEASLTRCTIPGCYTPFCSHENPGQTLCDKHTAAAAEPSPVAKKAKNAE